MKVVPLAVWIAAALSGGQGEPRLEAGCARADITPAVGQSINAGKPGAGIGTPLFAKALVLSAGGTTVAVVTLDVLLLDKPLAAEIRRSVEEAAGIPGRNVMLCASHTHCSPVSTRERWHLNVPERDYVTQVVRKVTGAVVEAKGKLREARAGHGKGRAAIVVNRWIETPQGARWGVNPDGPVDDEVGVLRIDDADGRPMAALVNFAAHSSVVDWKDRVFGGDYPAFVQSVMEKVYDGRVQVHFANGASGDTKIAFLTEDGKKFAYGKYEDARRYGTVIAGEAVKVFEQIRVSAVSRLEVRTSTADIPLLPHPSAEEVQAALEAKRRKGQETYWEERVLPSLKDGTAPKTVQGEVQAIHLDDRICLCAIPGELFAGVGLRIKRGLARDGFMLLGYANGYAGYLPTDESCRRDGAMPRYEWHKFFGYPSHFAEGVEEEVVRAVTEAAGPPRPPERR